MRTGVAGFQGERLAQLRQARGIKLAALAAVVDRSTGTLSKWEKGTQLPEPTALKKLSEALNVQQKWFLAPVAAYGHAPYFFRSTAAATNEARLIAKVKLDWLQELSGILQQWLDWPTIRLPHFMEGDFKRVTDMEIEAMAMECRVLWGLGLAPIPDVVLALENAGVICARGELGYSRMDGVSHWSSLDQRPYVFLVADKANGIRNRFDAAHELAHLVLHRGLEEVELHQRHSEIERQANLFAGAFLLPAEAFATEIGGWPTLDTFFRLKERWKVSIAAMIMRCKQLDLMTEDHTLRLWKNYSARGWRRGEPGDDQIPFEPMRLMPRGVNMVVDQHLYSKEALLHEFGLGRMDCEELCGLPPGYFATEEQSAQVIATITMKAGTGPSFSQPATVLSLVGRTKR